MKPAETEQSHGISSRLKTVLHFKMILIDCGWRARIDNQPVTFIELFVAGRTQDQVMDWMTPSGDLNQGSVIWVSYLSPCVFDCREGVTIILGL
jgi:hypothetical protein